MSGPAQHIVTAHLLPLCPCVCVCLSEIQTFLKQGQAHGPGVHPQINTAGLQRSLELSAVPPLHPEHKESDLRLSVPRKAPSAPPTLPCSPRSALCTGTGHWLPALPTGHWGCFPACVCTGQSSRKGGATFCSPGSGLVLVTSYRIQLKLLNQKGTFSGQP